MLGQIGSAIGEYSQMTKIEKLRKEWRKAVDAWMKEGRRTRTSKDCRMDELYAKVEATWEAYDNDRKGFKGSMRCTGRIAITDKNGKPMWDRNAMTAKEYFGDKLFTEREILDSVPDKKRPK